jgi:hypothetical protein
MASTATATRPAPRTAPARDDVTAVNPAFTPAPARDSRARPGNKSGRYVETSEYIQAARRFIRGAGRRVGDMDIAELPALAQLTAEADAVLQAAATRLHDECGYSWGDIGTAMGTTRQGAFRRFRRRELAASRTATPESQA